MKKEFDWKSILSDTEKIKLEFGISSVYAISLLLLTSAGAVVVAFSNLFAGFFILIMGFLYFWYLKRGKRFAFTDKRVILADTFIGKNIVSVNYNQITDTQFEQSFFDQMGLWGAITINTAGTHSPQITLSNINDPQKIKKELDLLRDSQNK